MENQMIFPRNVSCSLPESSKQAYFVHPIQPGLYSHQPNYRRWKDQLDYYYHCRGFSLVQIGQEGPYYHLSCYFRQGIDEPYDLSDDNGSNDLQLCVLPVPSVIAVAHPRV